MSAVEAFADDLLFEMLSLCPELAAELGLSAVDGRRLPAGGAPDFSEAGAAKRRALMDGASARLAGLSPCPGSTDEVTRRTLAYLLDKGMFGPFTGARARSFPEIPYPVNHLSGHHPTTVMMLSRDAAAASHEDAQTSLEVLRAWPAAIHATIESFRLREAEGRHAPRSTLEKSLADLQAFAADEPASNIVVLAFAGKLRASLGRQGADAWSRSAQKIIRREVLPACAALISAVEEQLARSDGDHGLWRHPDGEAHYAWLLQAHTTTDLDPRKVHALGLEETAGVQREIRSQFAALGIARETIGDLYDQSSGADQLAVTPLPASRERALAHTRDLLSTLQARAAPMFDPWPTAALEVELIAPQFEDSQHSCYTPPRVGGGRSGLFSLNLKDSLARPAWELPVLCAHEGTPGHHVQLALAQELPLCAFRRAVVFTAYIEGWAKYAETLLDHDLMDDPYVRLGRLRGELYSSVNLALDTGIHALRWTPEEAAAHFRAATGVDAQFAQAIVDRSLVWPGQLCAYKIGMLQFLKLRDAFAAAGAGLRAFHAAVLGHGSLPLSLLAELAGESLAEIGNQSGQPVVGAAG